MRSIAIDEHTRTYQLRITCTGTAWAPEHSLRCRLIAVAGEDPAIAELWDLNVRSCPSSEMSTAVWTHALLGTCRAICTW